MSQTFKSILKKPSNSKTKKKVSFLSPTKKKTLVIFKKPSQSKTKTLNIKEYSPTLKEKIENKSFSPSINENIKQKSITRSKLSLYEDDSFDIEGLNKKLKIPRINVYDKNNNKLIKKLNSSVARKKMLKNLTSKKKINCNQIVLPNQLLSNCWFNTFFVTFFISDKGFKFFKHIRKQMIKGRKLDNTLIEPARLRRSLLLLNYYIELSISKHLKSRKLAKDMNTNAIIYNIYHSLPSDIQEIKDVNKAGNPLTYYEGLLKLIKPSTFDLFSIVLNSKSELNKLRTIQNNELTNLYYLDYIPNIIILEVVNENISSMFNFKTMNYELTIMGNKYKYKLDSVIIRDTIKRHWGSVFTCNKEYYGFDGASDTRNNIFKWNEYLNKNMDWGFIGSTWKINNKTDTGLNIWWNFMNGVQYLFYFRV